MRSFPQHWRGDRGIMERVNPFGGACPDPDQWDYLLLKHGIKGATAEFVHGCIANPYSGDNMCARWTIDGSYAALLYQYPGHAATLDGRIWSWWYPSSFMNKSGDPFEIRTDLPPVEVNPRLADDEARVRLRRADGSTIRAQAGRVVWQAWQGELSQRTRIWQMNGDIFDNDIDNLTDGTRSPAKTLII